MLTAKQMNEARKALLEIKDKYESYPVLTEALNQLIPPTQKKITFQAVHQWYKRGVIPPARVPLLYKLSGKTVAMKRLRPDIYE